MTRSDILITMYADPTPFAESLSSYLADNALTITRDRAADFWAWIPIITPDCDQSQLASLVELFADRDIILIPILLENLSSCEPFAARFVIDVSEDAGDLQPYLVELRDRLFSGRRLLDKLQKLEAQYQVLDRQQETAPDQVRFRRYLDDLARQISLTRKALHEPKHVHDANQEAILTGIQSLISQPKTKRPNNFENSESMGHLLQGGSNAFMGRETEIAVISNYVLDDTNTRVISILGPGGVGKTALACHVLDILSEHDDVFTVLYFSAERRGRDFTLERLFTMTGEAFGDDVCVMLDRVWKNEKMALDTRIDYLIDQYVDERCLLLFDNLEDCLTPDGQFVDDELMQFVQQFLNRDHQATLLITSRIPVLLIEEHLSTTKIVPLSTGLSERYAVELLRAFDEDRTLGLRDATYETLSKIVKYTRGYPRALEAVAGILVNRPLVTLDELMVSDEVRNDEALIALWVNRAEAILDSDQRMVMQALSIFARPVTETAIQFLLDPYVEMTGIDIPFTLERLERGRYITVNHMSSDISIHPLDKDYNYHLIREGNPEVGRISAGERFLRQLNILPPVSEEPDDELFTRRTLEKRAGDFYAQLRGQPGDWGSIHDLQPYFLEYEHRLRAGDYDTSFTMLITVYNLLKLSGFSRKVVEMISPLIEYLSDTYLMTAYNMLGMAYDDLGRYQEALDCHLAALPLAQQDDNRPAEAAHLSGIGLQYSNLGEYEKALQHYEKALEIARETGRRKQERGVLNNMAVVYNSIGRKLEGLSYYEESLEIAREIGDRQGMAVTLANVGDSYGALGDVDKTIDCYQESIELYNAIGDKLGRGVTIGKMGNAAIMLGSYDDALKLLEVAVGIAQAVGNRMWEILHQADIAAVYTHQGDVDQGLKLLDQIIPQAEEIGSPILLNYIHSLMAGVLLYAGQFERASTASEEAIQYVNPANRHYEYALYGLILVRLERLDEARDAFYLALDHAAELLENTPDLYSPKYSRGLALMGLALVTDDMTYAEDAKTAYIAARQNCDAKGILNREMKKLKLLTGTLDDEMDLGVDEE